MRVTLEMLAIQDRAREDFRNTLVTRRKSNLQNRQG